MFYFVANLKSYLVNGGGDAAMFDAYLCSADYAAASANALETVHARKLVLAADNGNFDLIRELITRFEPAASRLQEARRVLEQKLGHYVRPGEMPPDLQRQFRQLAQSVQKAARSVISLAHVRTTIERQSGIRGDYLIGMEDLAVPTLTGLGVAPEYFAPTARWFEACAARATRWGERTAEGEFGDIGRAKVFAGVHAMDYDSAVRVGRVVGSSTLPGIATGLGGVLSDKTYVDFRVQNGRRQLLPGPVPRPYLRVAEIAAGLQEGFVTSRGYRPLFHALGVGTPILLPILALNGTHDTYFATDSTAPIVDGYSSATTVLYTVKPAPIKLKAYKIAEAILAGRGTWDCTCPHCTQFLAMAPFKLREAKKWWAAESRRSLTPSDLRVPSPLADLMPLLSNPQDPKLRAAAGWARVLHNHWVLRQLEKSARAHGRTTESLREWASKVVQNYVSSSADPEWKRAVQVAWSIADSSAVRLAGAKPGGGVRS